MYNNENNFSRRMWHDVASPTAAEIKAELYATGRDVYGELVFEIESRPVICLEITEIDNGQIVQVATPVCAERDYGEHPAGVYLRSNESIVDYVDVPFGSFAIFAVACDDVADDKPTEVCLETVIDGDHNGEGFDVFDLPYWVGEGAKYAELYGWCN